jgi:hypothetical protein
LRRWGRRTRRPALFFVSDLAIDEVADIIGILFLLLEQSLVAGFDFYIVVRHDRNLVLPGIGFIERNQHGFRARRRLLVIGHCRGAKSTFRPEA